MSPELLALSIRDSRSCVLAWSKIAGSIAASRAHHVFSSLVVPLTPPSLVKFSRRASGVITGESSSVPSSDHVPELRKAVPSRAEIAATAEPCRDMRRNDGSAGESRMPRNAGQEGANDRTRFDDRRRQISGSSSRCIKPMAHARFTGSTICVVVALVNSQTAFPVSQ